MVFEVASPFLSHDRLRVGLPHTILLWYQNKQTKQTNKQTKNPRLQLTGYWTTHWCCSNFIAEKEWKMTHYQLSKNSHFLAHVLNQDSIMIHMSAGNRQLIWRPPSHSQFCIMPTGHKLLTCLLTLHTPFYHADHCYHNTCHTETVFIILRHSWDESLMAQALQTSPTKDGNSVVTTIHRCFPLSLHNILTVAMVTMQEAFLLLMEKSLSKEHLKILHLQHWRYHAVDS